jgi:hypothetical protein
MGLECDSLDNVDWHSIEAIGTVLLASPADQDLFDMLGPDEYRPVLHATAI